MSYTRFNTWPYRYYVSFGIWMGKWQSDQYHASVEISFTTIVYSLKDVEERLAKELDLVEGDVITILYFHRLPKKSK